MTSISTHAYVFYILSVSIGQIQENVCCYSFFSMSKPTKQPSECKVCSGDAFNTYYGVKTCEPCKVFFKRNAENRKVKQNNFTIAKKLKSDRLLENLKM